MRMIQFKGIDYLGIIDAFLRSDGEVSYGLRLIYFIDVNGELDTILYNENNAFTPVAPDKYVSVSSTFKIWELD